MDTDQLSPAVLSRLGSGAARPLRDVAGAGRRLTGLLARLVVVAGGVGRELGWAAVAVVACVAFLITPETHGIEGADPSWAQLICVLAARGAQAGVDYVFPYGPLGPVLVWAYEPTFHATRTLWELPFKGAAALVLLRLARQLSPRAGAAVLGLAAFCPLANFGDVYLQFAALAAVWVPVLKGRVTVVDALLGPAFLAALGLAKFNFLVYSVAGLGVTTLYLAYRTRHWTAFGPAVVYAVATAVLWVGLGQAVGNFPEYARTGLEYSRGYAEAMAIPGPALETRLGLAVLGLVAAAVAAGGRAGLREPGAVAGLALLGLTTAVLWKYGFVRQDIHALTFFTFGLVLPLFVARAQAAAPRADLRLGLLAAAAGASALGAYEVLGRNGHFRDGLTPSLVGQWTHRFDAYAHPAAHRAEVDAVRKVRQAEFDLPAIRARVGAEPVDVFTEHQGQALLNGLNLAPRPTLQTMNACSVGMLERNAAFLAGPSAPRFVLVKWGTTDVRFPALADGPALLEVVRRYRPVLDEKGFVLFEKRPAPVGGANAGRVVLDRTVPFNETVPLPDAAGGYQTMTVDVPGSALGSLRSAAFRPPPVWLEVTNDRGVPQTYLMPPGMARAEFLIDPLVNGTDDIRDVAAGQPGTRTRSVLVHRTGGNKAFFGPAVRVTVRTYPPIPAAD